MVCVLCVSSFALCGCQRSYESPLSPSPASMFCRSAAFSHPPWTSAPAPSRGGSAMCGHGSNPGPGHPRPTAANAQTQTRDGVVPTHRRNAPHVWSILQVGRTGPQPSRFAPDAARSPRRPPGPYRHGSVTRARLPIGLSIGLHGTGLAGEAEGVAAALAAREPR